MRRDKGADTVSRAAQCLRQIGADRTLAVGPRDVNDPERAVRRAERI